MKILYGIQATGNGHIARSRIMAHHLSTQNIKVDYLFSGRDKDKLFDMDVFGDYIFRKGLSFTTECGKVSYIKTALNNNLLKCIFDIAQLKVRDYDLIITDFEPITAWAAKLHGVPSLAIGHQYAFGPNTPIAGETALAKAIMKYFAPAKDQIGLHWHPYDKNILPPIIDTNIRRQKTNEAIIVYLPFENQESVTELLSLFPQQKFILYSPDLSDNEKLNISMRKTCLNGFKKDLCAAKGVISNSGFELISECIHLGLPILTKPLSGQMEQISNAKALAELNYATITNRLNYQSIERWLQKPQYSQNATPDVAREIVELIIEKKLDRLPILSKTLWEGVEKL